MKKLTREFYTEFRKLEMELEKEEEMHNQYS